MNKIIFLIACSLIFSCTSFKEDHYFQSVGKENGKATNYFKLQVKGGAQLSQARYIAGYYDERAVDLYFNELKKVSNGETFIQPIFPDELKEPGSTETIQPLSPNNQKGAFVMILSTNAQAVANAIGQFADNQIIADSITNLANQNILKQLSETEYEPKFEIEQAKAAAREIDAMFKTMPTDRTPSGDEAVRIYLRILNTISRAAGNDAPFKTFKEAESWFRRNTGR